MEFQEALLRYLNKPEEGKGVCGKEGRKEMGNGKQRWRVFYKSSSSSNASKRQSKEPPKEFLCPISGSLMADPVIVSSGQTFERACVQVCKALGFNPTLSEGSSPDFSTIIPNLAIQSTILSWCDKCSVDRPKPLDFDSAEKVVRTLMASQKAENKSEDSDKELIKAVAETPPVLKFAHAITDLNRRSTHFYSSSQESVTTTGSTPPLPLATRPSCYSSSSSSEIETLNPDSPEEDEGIIAKLKSPQVFEQEEALVSLRKITRTGEETRVSLCSPRLLSMLRSLIISRYSGIQCERSSSSGEPLLEKINKVKIVRSGIVPPLIDVLKGGFPEAQDHAAGALFSLALEDANKTAIGVLGALPPLLHTLRSESERARNDSALALYHLSLVQSNRTKLVKLGQWRTAMLDAGAVECLVGLLRGNELDSDSIRESCLAALYALSFGGSRFKGLAKEAGAMETLMRVEKIGSERAREKAKKILEIMREKTEEGLDWEALLDSGLVVSIGGALCLCFCAPVVDDEGANKSFQELASVENYCSTGGSSAACFAR
ncbi:U-box domain-containing protein 40 [Vitis vinifera]|uniref:RING-type E3 ubiquitin transferase n=1 Tax=Vitis vinifera TaxID=29760 RepID=A0A438JIR3_VITVI|nr:U-box domain-containing protein 40 [Vitis vinifera]